MWYNEVSFSLLKYYFLSTYLHSNFELLAHKTLQCWNACQKMELGIRSVYTLNFFKLQMPTRPSTFVILNNTENFFGLTQGKKCYEDDI